MARRPLAGLTALGLVLSMGMATPSPSPESADTPAPAPGALPAATRLTLITGDVVTYGKAADGTPRADVKPARRAGGAPVSFVTLRKGGSFYVFPSDALAPVASGQVDKGLFDVAYLAANGYTDAERPTLPVIVQYGAAKQAAATLSARADALPATASPVALASVGGAAVKVDKKAAREFWTAAAASPTASPSARATTPTAIWLDRKMKAVLDKSVPQIGAPQAWAAGYKGKGVKVAVLDTGVDPDHPDLAGRIGATANFTDDPDARDGHGHGTHVASTIAGSGRYTGVAPEATLLVGKVLSSSGTGTSSQVIAGMQWAAAQAKVVSISIGGEYEDQNGPINQAVNTLSAETGALFVVAAGNDGGSRTVNAPGSAAAALTVGAVDREERLAPFSSRGPAPFDYGLKPDVVAPGVGIVAARARGTSMGSPVDELHTAASGTSMATPHVSGAAAILAGQHPDWTGPQLKAALTGTAKDDGLTAYQQGAGRIDVARAVTQRVRGSGNLDFGFLPSPQSGPVTKKITYTNDGDQPVTLTLRASIAAHRGTAPEQALKLDRDTVTVPAHGAADVTVAFDPSGPATWYAGAVAATGGDVVVRTAVGAFVEPRRVRLRTELIMPDGAADAVSVPWLFLRTDDRDDLDSFYQTAEGEASVYPGTFSVNTIAAWRGEDGEWQQSLPTAPEVKVDRDTTVTLDLRKAREVRLDTPRTTETYLSHYALRRTTANGVVADFLSSYPAYGLHHYWMLPTEPVKQGALDLTGQFWQGAPLVTMKAAGRTLAPRYAGVTPDLPKLTGKQTLSLVDVGHGTDLSGLDVRGKLALLDLGDLCPDTTCSGDGLDRVQALAAAGAVGVLGYGASGRAFLDPTGSWAFYPIPTMSLPADQGRALARKPVDVKVEGSPATPYMYSLFFPERGRIPAGLDYRVTRKNLQEIDDRFHSDRPGAVRMSWTPVLINGSEPFAAWGLGGAWQARTTVTEYVGPVSPDVTWQREVRMRYDEGDLSRTGYNTVALDVFTRAGRRTERWGMQPRVPGGPRDGDRVIDSGTATCFACRTGDLFTSAVPVMGPEPNHQEPFTWSANFQAWAGGKDELHLYRDGREVPLEEKIGALGPVAIKLPTFTLPPDEGEYRLTDTFHTPQPGQRFATDVETAWTFRSKRPESGMKDLTDGLCAGWLVTQVLAPCAPVRRLNLSYDLDLDLDNQAAAGATRRITVTGYNGSFGQPDAKLTALRLSATFDGGAHWVPVRMSASGDRAFTGTITHPPLSRTDGAVGLRAQATDQEGNTVDQTIHKAYGLKQP
ncbi:S8 family serine peptidase [Nonomuraea sp. NPDC049758]|uniref:S8 family peptidase n=1 Tax=Nonomuraea sp. NPDC049758 TaxID=3154360 RepID=UPI0034437161